VGDVTVPVPEERVGEFLSHAGAWLQSPPGSLWQVTKPTPEMLPWDHGRAGELAIAASLWSELDTEQKKVVETLHAEGGEMEASELAKLLGVSGEIAVQQQVRKVNLACKARGRPDALASTAIGDRRGVKLAADFANVLLLGPCP